MQCRFHSKNEYESVYDQAKTMISREFYKELGKLIYALAKADGQIQPKETEKLIEMLRASELHAEKGEIIYLQPDKYYTEFEFILYKEKKIAVKDAFYSFINFIKSIKLF